jgi:3-methyladenine DNA glycosylase AlkC
VILTSSCAIPWPTVTRTGARSYASIDPAVIRAISSGRRESATHVEQMAADMSTLLVASFPTAAAHVGRFEGLPFLSRMREGGQILVEVCGQRAPSVIGYVNNDIVRGWRAFAVGLIPERTLEQRLHHSRAFASDGHFAVRESAWLGVRRHVVCDPSAALDLLGPWANDRSPFIRRFAVEVTRPRSVWGTHCAALKEAPELALPFLERFATDRDRYVEDALANWLNDARRTRPEWVQELCRRWFREQGSAAGRLCRRALRVPASCEVEAALTDGSQTS